MDNKKINNIPAQIHRVKIVFSLLSLGVTLSFFAIIFVSLSTNNFPKFNLPSLDDWKRWTSQFMTVTKIPEVSNSPLEENQEDSKTESTTSSSSSTVTVQINDKQEKPTIKYVPPKPCNRYTVTHLDGSTSNLCYTASDYNSLLSLGYQLSSAKTFYNFQMDGVQRYQDEYDRTKSSIYLDAKASTQKQADREKEKIGAITLQMQQIEQRGW